MTTKNYFELLDLPTSYDIDFGQLTKNYLAAQRKYFEEFSGQIGRELNNAYNTLKDDIKRGEYLLNIKGIALSDTISSKNAAKMFQLREEYENLSDEKSQNNFREDLRNEIQKSVDVLKSCNDMSQFADTLSVAKFMSAFLDKVKVDVYSRN